MLLRLLAVLVVVAIMPACGRSTTPCAPDAGLTTDCCKDTWQPCASDFDCCSGVGAQGSCRNKV